MWYDPHMTKEVSEDDLLFAQAAVDNAQGVRKHHRRRTARGDERREADIKLAAERIQSAMKPLRSYLCGYMYGPQTETRAEKRVRVESLSKQLQAERRKLFKMKA